MIRVWSFTKATRPAGCTRLLVRRGRAANDASRNGFTDLRAKLVRAVSGSLATTFGFCGIRRRAGRARLAMIFHMQLPSSARCCFAGARVGSSRTEKQLNARPPRVGGERCRRDVTGGMLEARAPRPSTMTGIASGLTPARRPGAWTLLPDAALMASQELGMAAAR